jgi:hypothetical protein
MAILEEGLSFPVGRSQHFQLNAIEFTVQLGCKRFAQFNDASSKRLNPVARVSQAGGRCLYVSEEFLALTLRHWQPLRLLKNLNLTAENLAVAWLQRVDRGV